MGSTWGPVLPGFAGIRSVELASRPPQGQVRAAPNRTAEQVYGQPKRRVGVRVRRSQLMREKSLVPKFR